MPWTLNLSSVCLNKVSIKVTLHSVLTFKKDQHARTDSRDRILLALWCFHFVTYYFLYGADTGFLLRPTPLQPHQIPQNSLWQNTFLTLASKAPLEATAPFEIKRLWSPLSGCLLPNDQVLVCENKQHQNYWYDTAGWYLWSRPKLHRLFLPPTLSSNSGQSNIKGLTWCVTHVEKILRGKSAVP